MLNTNSFNMMSDPKKYVTDSGKVVDLSSAYRRLSDGAMLRSGGALSSLPNRKASDPTKGVTEAPEGALRLQKDDFEEDEGAIESSDDEEYSTGSSDGEGWGSHRGRGRQRTRQEDNNAGKNGVEVITAKSLLAAAEAERESSISVEYCNILTTTRQEGLF
jgi:hypothetical protein